MTNSKKGNTLLVIANAEWAKTLPEWLLKEIEAERVIAGFCDLLGKEHEPVGDAEVVAYLMTASLTAPLPYEYTNIYLYCAGRVLERCRRGPVPTDIRVTRLTEAEAYALKRLRGDIFDKRGGKVWNSLLAAIDEVFQLEKRQKRR